MRKETFEAIELFVEKVEKLKSFDFVKNPKLVQFQCALKYGDETVEISGPEDQNIDAFLFTYRFFFDKKEHCSFRWLAENVLDDPGLSLYWKGEFCKLRDRINGYLDSYPAIKVTHIHYPTPMRNREIKDLILFGNLSHATWDMKKRKKYKQLISHSPTKALLTKQFVDILFITFYVIIKVSDLCKSELEKEV